MIFCTGVPAPTGQVDAPNAGDGNARSSQRNAHKVSAGRRGLLIGGQVDISVDRGDARAGEQRDVHPDGDAYCATAAGSDVAGGVGQVGCADVGDGQSVVGSERNGTVEVDHVGHIVPCNLDRGVISRQRADVDRVGAAGGDDPQQGSGVGKRRQFAQRRNGRGLPTAGVAHRDRLVVTGVDQFDDVAVDGRSDRFQARITDRAGVCAAGPVRVERDVALAGADIGERAGVVRAAVQCQ